MAEFSLKLGTNELASGPVMPADSEEMPILWQGDIGPGNLFLTFSRAKAATAEMKLPPIGYDFIGAVARAEDIATPPV